MINKLKQLTQGKKARLRNLKYKYHILSGLVTPSDEYGIAYKSKCDNMSAYHRKQQEAYCLLVEMRELKDEINMVGHTILLLRGNKWRF